MKIIIEINQTKRNRDGLANISITVPDLELRSTVVLPFEEIYNRCGIPDRISLDFLLIASLCYAIDKTISRSTAFDFWTRTLEVEFPVSNFEKWNNAVEDLTKALNFLTGDIWLITFCKMENSIFQAPPPKKRRKIKPKLEKVDAVCSFSGGVDSLVGTINLLKSGDYEGIHLIGHYDAPGAKKAQNLLFDGIKAEYVDKAELIQVRVSQNPVKANESTLRSRSIVFMAIGLFVARSADKKTPIFMPENGFIALNVPLTPSRGGSCSTRTMHPYFLTKISKVFEGLSIENKIINPLEFLTKGECVSECLNKKLLHSIIPHTVSCSHGTRKQNWVRKTANVKNCGYCVPCLVRRASLHKSNLDKPEDYGFDVCSGELRYNDARNSSNDLRAIINMLKASNNRADFKKNIIGVAPTDRLNDRSELLIRGFNEIKTLFNDKSTSEVLHTLGL